MLVALYAIRYTSPDGAPGVVYVIAKSTADALMQLKGCSPALTVTHVDCTTHEDTPTPLETALATVLQRTAGLLERLAEKFQGPGTHALRAQAKAQAADGLGIAGQVLSRG